MISGLVSIIVPCFNDVAFVGDAIRSALVQTYEKKEVIVIDDGSDDRSLDVIKSFGDRIVWETGPNRGGSTARNLGLRLAKGEFVQFLDADDLLLPQCVSRKVAERLRNPSISPSCNWMRVHEGVSSIIKPSSAFATDSVIAVLSGQIAVCSPLHTRDELDAIGGFDTDLASSQERDLHLRLACSGVRFGHLDEALATVRRHAGSVSSDYTKVLLNHGYIFSRAGDSLHRSGLLTEERRFSFARTLASDARQLFHRGMVAPARECWSLANDFDKAGLHAAYGRPYTRLLLKIVGPEVTDRLVYAARSSIRLSRRREPWAADQSSSCPIEP